MHNLQEKHFHVIDREVFTRIADNGTRVLMGEDKAAKECTRITLQHTKEELMWLNLLVNTNDPLKQTINDKISELEQQIKQLDK